MLSWILIHVGHSIVSEFCKFQEEVFDFVVVLLSFYILNLLQFLFIISFKHEHILMCVLMVPCRIRLYLQLLMVLTVSMCSAKWLLGGIRQHLGQWEPFNNVIH
jgi:hypothetical protein